jgi:uncharacterized membrane protein
MSPIRIIGIAVLAVGVVLLFFGLQQADSPVDQISEALTGRYTEGTMWYLIGGIVAIVVGGLLALFGDRGARV